MVCLKVDLSTDCVVPCSWIVSMLATILPCSSMCIEMSISLLDDMAVIF